MKYSAAMLSVYTQIGPKKPPQSGEMTQASFLGSIPKPPPLKPFALEPTAMIRCVD